MDDIYNRNMQGTGSPASGQSTARFSSKVWAHAAHARCGKTTHTGTGN